MEHVLELERPLQFVRPAHHRPRAEAWSLDGTTHEVVTFGAGVNEAVARIRFDPASMQIVELIRAGRSGISLTYEPDLADPERAFTLALLAPDPEDVPDYEDSLDILEYFTIELRVRRTDGGILF